MVTIETLSSLSRAFLLRSMLEASEIPAFIPDEYTAQNGFVTGGIRVQVAEEFVAQARPVVAAFWEAEGER
jgi:hypothetical protein